MTPSGNVTLSVEMNFAIPAGGAILTAYNLPITPEFASAYAAGTAANQVQNGAQTGGSAAAAPVSIDLSTIARVDGTTGFTHIRELILVNDATVDSNVLKWDMTVSNAFNLGFEGSSLKVDIAAGEVFRRYKPIGTNGWLVDGTHKVISLDPGANTIAYRAIFLGD